MFKENILEELSKHVKSDVVLEVPPDPKMGDFAFPCFSLAKSLKKSPVLIAKDLAEKIKKPDFVEKVSAEGPYVNFFLDAVSVAKVTIEDIFKAKSKYGSSLVLKGATFALDYSHPNIGKPFHFGHLRSTIIGESIARILEFQGAKVLRLNYLGDWGTQFGKLICAYLKWGDEKKLKADPVPYMLELYIKFHKEAEKDNSLNEEARQWFAKLEKKDKQATELWNLFRNESLKEFKRIYDILDVKFDSFEGEASIAPKVQKALDFVKKKGACELDQGALVSKLGFDAPLILVKSDGSTTYGSRDVAAVLHRVNDLNADKLLYVVGHEQALHFQQLFALMDKLGFPEDDFKHVSFGFYLDPKGGKLSTRKGKVVLMNDVLNETIGLAQKTVEEKNPDLRNKEEVARVVGVGAIKFGDLITDRVKDVIFDLQKILSFEGDTGPYLMYTHARAASVVRKAAEIGIKPSKDADFSLLGKDVESRLIKMLPEFSKKIVDASDQYKPHIVAHYLLELARCFNEFYHSCPVLKDDKKVAEARLVLVEATRQVINNGLDLLGITALSEM